MDEALDLLSDSLGQREPDPDENKPVVDKVKVTKDILKLEQFGEGWEGANQTNKKKTPPKPPKSAMVLRCSQKYVALGF